MSRDNSPLTLQGKETAARLGTAIPLSGDEMQKLRKLLAEWYRQRQPTEEIACLTTQHLLRMGVSTSVDIRALIEGKNHS